MRLQVGHGKEPMPGEAVSSGTLRLTPFSLLGAPVWLRRFTIVASGCMRSEAVCMHWPPHLATVRHSLYNLYNLYNLYHRSSRSTPSAPLLRRVARPGKNRYSDSCPRDSRRDEIHWSIDRHNY